MLDLIKIEYKKIIPYRTFWVIFGLVFLLTPAVFYGIGQMGNDTVSFSSIYQFPDVWNNITYLGSWFNLLIGMCVVILICNEFSFKTFRQHVIDGQDKVDFIVSKVLLIVSFALFSALYLFIVGFLFGSISGGSDVSFVKDIKYLLIYFIQAIGYMSVALIVATLVRSTALSIILFLSSIAIESIIQLAIPYPFDKYFPMEIIANLTPNPFLKDIAVQPGIEIANPLAEAQIPLNTTLIVAVVYIFIFWGITYFILTKKDIK